MDVNIYTNEVVRLIPMELLVARLGNTEVDNTLPAKQKVVIQNGTITFPVHGAFKIDTALGSGSHGDVYMCTQTAGSNYTVAVKEHIVAKETDPVIQAEYVHAVRLIRDTQRCPVLSGHAFYGIEYGADDSGTMYGLQTSHPCAVRYDEYVRTHPMDAPAEQMRMIYTMAQAGNELHQNGYCNPDIRPANWMCTDEENGGKIYMIDFGALGERDSDVCHMTSLDVMVFLGSILYPTNASMVTLGRKLLFANPLGDELDQLLCQAMTQIVDKIVNVETKSTFNKFREESTLVRKVTRPTTGTSIRRPSIPTINTRLNFDTKPLAKLNVRAWGQVWHHCFVLKLDEEIYTKGSVDYAIRDITFADVLAIFDAHATKPDALFHAGASTPVATFANMYLGNHDVMSHPVDEADEPVDQIPAPGKPKTVLYLATRVQTQ